MKCSEILSLALLPLLCLGAKKASQGRFEEYYARFQSSAPLRLDDASYDELTAAPRNHSVVVLLTALEARFGCQLCRDFQPEWDILGKSWAKGDRNGESRTLLGTLDFADGKVTFQKVSYCLG
jgi:oligosaccharyltransferase complex subunit gamma